METVTAPGNLSGHKSRLNWEVGETEWCIVDSAYHDHFCELFDSSQLVDSVKSFRRASSASWLFHSLWSLIIVIFCWNHRRPIIVALWPWSGFLGFQTLYTRAELSNWKLKYIFMFPWNSPIGLVQCSWTGRQSWRSNIATPPPAKATTQQLHWLTELSEMALV